MAKAKGGKSKGFVSQGKYKNVSQKTKNLVRNGRSGLEVQAAKMAAYWKGQNPWITMENPNKEETNKRFIKVKANDLYGLPKNRGQYMMGKK